MKTTPGQEAEMKKLEESALSGCSPMVPFRGALPSELRVHAMIGSLGWDTDGHILKQRA